MAASWIRTALFGSKNTPEHLPLCWEIPVFLSFKEPERRRHCYLGLIPVLGLLSFFLAGIPEEYEQR